MTTPMRVIWCSSRSAQMGEPKVLCLASVGPGGRCGSQIRRKRTRQADRQTDRLLVPLVELVLLSRVQYGRSGRESRLQLAESPVG